MHDKQRFLVAALRAEAEFLLELADLFERVAIEDEETIASFSASTQAANATWRGLRQTLKKAEAKQKNEEGGMEQEGD